MTFPRRRPIPRHARSALLATALLVHAALVTGSEEAPPGDALIKAELVFKIAKFVEWPEGLLAGGVLKFCAVGDSPVAAALSAVDGRPIHRLQAHFRHLEMVAVASIMDCHVLYLGPGEFAPPASALASVPILTVSDRAGFAGDGGMIGLVTSVGRVSFVVNLRAVRTADLQIAAPLLDLATVVE